MVVVYIEGFPVEISTYPVREGLFQALQYLKASSLRPVQLRRYPTGDLISLQDIDLDTEGVFLIDEPGWQSKMHSIISDEKAYLKQKFFAAEGQSQLHHSGSNNLSNNNLAAAAAAVTVVEAGAATLGQQSIQQQQQQQNLQQQAKGQQQYPIQHVPMLNNQRSDGIIGDLSISEAKLIGRESDVNSNNLTSNEIPNNNQVQQNQQLQQQVQQTQQQLQTQTLLQSMQSQIAALQQQITQQNFNQQQQQQQQSQNQNLQQLNMKQKVQENQVAVPQGQKVFRSNSLGSEDSISKTSTDKLHDINLNQNLNQMNRGKNSQQGGSGGVSVGKMTSGQNQIVSQQVSVVNQQQSMTLQQFKSQTGNQQQNQQTGSQQSQNGPVTVQQSQQQQNVTGSQQSTVGLVVSQQGSSTAQPLDPYANELSMELFLSKLDLPKTVITSIQQLHESELKPSIFGGIPENILLDAKAVKKSDIDDLHWIKTCVRKGVSFSKCSRQGTIEPRVLLSNATFTVFIVTRPPNIKRKFYSKSEKKFAASDIVTIIKGKASKELEATRSSISPHNCMCLAFPHRCLSMIFSDQAERDRMTRSIGALLGKPVVEQDDIL